MSLRQFLAIAALFFVQGCGGCSPPEPPAEVKDLTGEKFDLEISPGSRVERGAEPGSSTEP